jgi:signal recognition particle receptor subunit beta
MAYGVPLTDIPGQLRALADRIEFNDGLPGGGAVVVVLDAREGPFDVAAFGFVDSLTAQAVLATGVSHLAAMRLRAAR